MPQQSHTLLVSCVHLDRLIVSQTDDEPAIKAWKRALTLEWMDNSDVTTLDYEQYTHGSV